MAAVFKYASCLAAIAVFCISCAGTPDRPQPVEGRGLALFESAERLFDSPGYEAALGLYETHLALYPDSAMAPAAMLRKGMIHARMKQHAAARKVYETIVSRFPGSDFAARARLEILFSYAAEGQSKEALDYAESLGKIHLPRAMAVHADLAAGDACMKSGNFHDALDYYMRAFSKAPEQAGEKAGRRIAEAAARIDPDRLGALIEDFGTRPPAGYLVYARGLALAEAGYTGEAAALFSGFAKRFSGHRLSDEAAFKIREFGKTGRFHGRRIGVLLPLTGEYAAFGEKARSGIELAAAKYRERRRPGPPPEIAVYDTGPGEARAVQGVASLAAQNVAAIVALAVDAEEAAKEADKMEIPFIAMTQKPGVTEIGEYVFRNFLTSDRQVETLVDYAMGRLGMRRFAVLYPDEAYGKRFRDLFARELDKRGGVLAGTGVYRPGETDFSESIIKMGAISKENEEDRRFSAGVDFDAVFIPDSPRVAGLIIPQLRYYDITDIPMLGTNLWHSEQLIQIAGRELGEVLIPEGFFPKSSKNAVRDFVSSYEEQYGATPGIIEASAYDSALLLFEVLENPDIKDRRSLKAALLTMPGFEGVTGNTVFDGTGEAVKRLYLLEALVGRFSEIH